MSEENNVSRRDILKLGSAGVIGLAGSYLVNTMTGLTPVVKAATHSGKKHGNMNHSNNMMDVSKSEGYKMAEKLLTTFDFENVSILPNGQTLRVYEVEAIDKEIEIAKGIMFPGLDI